MKIGYEEKGSNYENNRDNSSFHCFKLNACDFSFSSQTSSNDSFQLCSTEICDPCAHSLTSRIKPTLAIEVLERRCKRSEVIYEPDPVKSKNISSLKNLAFRKPYANFKSTYNFNNAIKMMETPEVLPNIRLHKQKKSRNVKFTIKEDKLKYATDTKKSNKQTCPQPRYSFKDFSTDIGTSKILPEISSMSCKIKLVEVKFPNIATKTLINSSQSNSLSFNSKVRSIKKFSSYKSTNFKSLDRRDL